MTRWPGDQEATSLAGRGHLRTSYADREHVIDELKEAFVQGRLTQDELGTRTAQVLASRTYAELAAVTADIPARLPQPRPPQSIWPRPQKTVSRRAVAWTASAIILPPVLGAFFLTFYGGFIILFIFAFIAATVTAQP